MKPTKLQQEILDQVKNYGGFSIFWATEDQNRAAAIMLLEKRGIIKRQKDLYPRCRYIINCDPELGLEEWND